MDEEYSGVYGHDFPRIQQPIQETAHACDL